MKKNISILTPDNIKSGKLTSLIPEFYNLKNAIENNPWHYKQRVFDHSLEVFKNLEIELKKLDKRTKNLLNKKVNNKTRKELLKVATLFHDIAKKDTIKNKPNHLTSCANHEAEGAKKVKKILKRFNLSTKEINFISEIIKNHDLIHKTLPASNKKFSKNLENLKKNFSKTIYPELILLGFADTINGHLAKSKPKDYKSRIFFYKSEVKNLH